MPTDSSFKTQTYWQWNSSYGSYAIHYIERGVSSKHVLLIHGFAGHSFTWRHQIDELAQTGYHVWSLDLLGSGYSDKPLEVPYGLDLFMAQIEAFMEAHRISQASLVGNSMGGGLAAALALDYPERVRSLVLIDALIYPMQLPFVFTVSRTLGNLTKSFYGKWLVKQVLKNIIYNQEKISEEQITAYELPYLMPGGKEAAIKLLQSFDKKELETLSSRLAQIKVPILLIWGEKDRWIPIRYYKCLTQAFPSAQKTLIPNCGHIPQEECPQEVNQAMLCFFRNHNKLN